MREEETQRLFACFKLDVLEPCHSCKIVAFHLQIKVCVLEINNKVPTGPGNAFIGNERGTRKCISGS